MESQQDNRFSQRMLRSERSSRTLLRQQKVLEEITDKTYQVLPVIVNHQDDGATIDSLSTAIERIDMQIEVLEERRTQRIYPTLSPVKPATNINSETRVLDDDVEVIGETPKMRRRSYKPNMESTRTSLTPLQSKNSQVESTISSIPVNGSSNADSRIPYEVERFLEDALGDELNNTTVTYENDGRERTDSHFNASELISEGTTPFYRRISEFLHHKRKNEFKMKDETFSKGVTGSSTLDRSMKIYRTLSQRIKKKIRGALMKDKSPELSPPEPPRDLPFDTHRMELMEEILKHMKIQQCIIQQASKALNVCRTNKEFIGSSEEIESERLLLLGEIRKRLLQEELKKLSDTSAEISPKPIQSSESAEVTIEHIALNLREALHRPPAPGEVTEYFLIVIIEGNNVWGSSPVNLPLESLILEFPDFVCRIENLQPSLKIVLEVYSLKLKSGVVYDHEDKYHIANSRMNKTVTCPSPSKLLKKMEKTASARVLPPHNVCSSSFVKCGELELGLYDLTLSSPWPLSGVPHESVLYGTIELNLSCKLHLSINHQGFLNYGEEAGGFITWNRRWCVLKGHTLMFWNYPREQEEKEPVNCIDLINCVSETIREVSRQLCAKPRTICVETVRSRGENDVDSILVECRERHTFYRHLLSFDTKKDLIVWTCELNHVISALREWNVTFAKDTPRSTMLSDL